MTGISSPGRGLALMPAFGKVDREFDEEHHEMTSLGVHVPHTGAGSAGHYIFFEGALPN